MPTNTCFHVIVRDHDTDEWHCMYCGEVEPVIRKGDIT